MNKRLFWGLLVAVAHGVGRDSQPGDQAATARPNPRRAVYADQNGLAEIPVS